MYYKDIIETFEIKYFINDYWCMTGLERKHELKELNKKYKNNYDEIKSKHNISEKQFVNKLDFYKLYIGYDVNYYNNLSDIESYITASSVDHNSDSDLSDL